MLGTFWRPDVPDWPSSAALPEERVAGQFIMASDRAWSLDLLGSLLPSGEPAHIDPNQPPPNFDVIYGINRENACMSLFDAWRSSYSLFAAIQDKETWTIGWYAEGKAWVEPQDEIDCIKIEYDLLPDWGWPNKHTGGGYDHSEQKFSVPQTQKITAEVNGATIGLHFGWRQNLATHQYLARAQATIEIHDNLLLDAIRDKWVFPLQVLLEFLTLNHVDPKKVIAQPSDADSQVKIHYNVYRPTDLAEQSDTGVHPSKMLATLSHLSNCGIDLQTLLLNYFALTHNENHEVALWFLKESAQRLIDKTVDTSLLNAFRALERYHDGAIDGTAIPEDEHATRVASVVENTPSEHKQWVQDQLSGANKKGLRKQLKEVLGQAESTAMKIEGAYPNFFDSIVSLRTKVAHGIPATGSQTGLRYYAAATGLRWILRHVYLRELGLSDHDAAEAISNCIPFEQELRLLKDWYGQLKQG